MLQEGAALGAHEHGEGDAEPVACGPEEATGEREGDADVVALACGEVACSGEEEEWVPEAEDDAWGEGKLVVGI